jgi:ABC-type branched-subunit amino acid transport system ATPase component
MSMTIRLKNLGILKQAEFSLGDLTIICGENNTGKTYATYALYGFLSDWRRSIDFFVTSAEIRRLLTDGVIKIDLAQYAKKTNRILAKACARYNRQLDDVFAATEGRFSKSEFLIELEPLDIRKIKNIKYEQQTKFFSYSKRKGSKELIVTLLTEDQFKRISSNVSSLSSLANRFISERIRSIIFADSFPAPFISSTERTGVAIFRKELNFARNRLLNEIVVEVARDIDPRGLVATGYQNYPSPIENNVDFIRELENIEKRKSFIVREHPEVLEEFSDIIGGDYSITQNDQLYYLPRGTRVRLTMDQSSSSVRSLLDIGFYLRCVARKGDLLMVDEPELNLHPANQRRIARLFARLVNLGIKVFVTTHSDYIVKELNTLIMLNHDEPHLKRIAQENNYQDAELIRPDRIKVYMTKIKTRINGYTLEEADIDPELGIEAPSFDETIKEMNKIQRDIVWGAE